MQADILNAFLKGSVRCFEQETGAPVQRIGLDMDASEHVSYDVNVYVALVGEVQGMCMVSMSLAVARGLAGRMMGEPLVELNEIALSALAEVGNLVSGGATVQLGGMGLFCDITPPMLMIGKRSRISTLGLPRFIIPLMTDVGQIDIQVAAEVRKS